MGNGMLAKPNLKLFLLGAILIAIISDVISNGKTQASVFRPTNPRIVSFVTDQELETLLREVESRPTAAKCARISEAYEKRGDARKAARFLQLANFYVQFEEAD